LRKVEQKLLGCSQQLLYKKTLLRF
jgi:hypothetical protein